MKPPKTISIIVATDENYAIGKNNELLCHLPNDLKYFKKVTKGHTVIMGQRTFESLPNGALPNRKNIVLTFDKDVRFPGCIMAYSIEDALRHCEGEQEVFFIGGGQVYKTAFEFADRLYITRIHHQFEGADTFFPEIKSSEWLLTQQEKHKADEKHAHDYTFLVYERKK